MDVTHTKNGGQSPDQTHMNARSRREKPKGRSWQEMRDLEEDLQELGKDNQRDSQEQRRMET